MNTVNPLEDEGIQKAIASCSKTQRFVIGIWVVEPDEDKPGQNKIQFTRFIHDFPVPDFPEVQKMLKGVLDSEAQKAVNAQLETVKPINAPAELPVVPKDEAPILATAPVVAPNPVPPDSNGESPKGRGPSDPMPLSPVINF